MATKDTRISVCHGEFRFATLQEERLDSVCITNSTLLTGCGPSLPFFPSILVHTSA